MKPPFAILALLSLLLFFTAAPASAQFAWTDTEGKHLELTFQNRPVARYVYEAIDESSPQRRDETYKPFCHIFRPDKREDFLTKGAGGSFTHHRGIYYGFSKISYTDRDGKQWKNIDTWHCRKAHQVHRRFSAQEANEKSAHFTSVIDWVGDDGQVFATEERTMRFSYPVKDLVVDFESKLTPSVPTLRLDGDPQHAGFHFRAHNDIHDVSPNATYYIRPVSGIGQPGIAINWTPKTDNEQTRDLPWKGMCFLLDNKFFTVAYLDHPGNPKPARASERQYGRFGTYFATDVIPEKPLSVRYRLVIRQGEMTVEEITKLSEDFRG
jgi:hypothetical protein